MATLVKIHYLVRKRGHFTEYFILSLLISGGIRSGRREMHLFWALLAILMHRRLRRARRVSIRTSYRAARRPYRYDSRNRSANPRGCARMAG
jgi:hypothetical protein